MNLSEKISNEYKAFENDNIEDLLQSTYDWYVELGIEENFIKDLVKFVKLNKEDIISWGTSLNPEAGSPKSNGDYLI